MTLQASPALVFLVEDIAVIRDNLMVALTEVAGVRVVAFEESEAGACAWLVDDRNEWDIAVIDLFLKSGGSGLRVLNACAARGATQRAIVLTNFATSEIRTRCLAAGADAVFDKSTEIDDFLAYCMQFGERST